MKVVKKSQSITYKYFEGCEAIEYPMNDEDINIAVVKIKGRYPEHGFLVNEISKELVLVQDGIGIIGFKNDGVIDLEKGDVVLIEPKDIYFWEGDLKLVTSCNPAWSIKQHKRVN